jgi:hypothetical protein
MPEGSSQAGRESKIGEHAVRSRDLTLYVFEI